MSFSYSPLSEATVNNVRSHFLFKIQCFPLESILAALDNPTVNLFVLDIEGFELAVLRAINWDKVSIEVSLENTFQVKSLLLMFILL